MPTDWRQGCRPTGARSTASWPCWARRSRLRSSRLELQARWVAGVWSGAVPAPSQQRMRAGIAEQRAMRALMPFDMHPALAALLAGELGVEPSLATRPELAEGLLFGPLAPARYRLDGPGARPEAEALLRDALADFVRRHRLRRSGFRA
jgi:Flavin-binding monooxygenase-like